MCQWVTAHLLTLDSNESASSECRDWSSTVADRLTNSRSASATPVGNQVTHHSGLSRRKLVHVRSGTRSENNDPFVLGTHLWSTHASVALDEFPLHQLTHNTIQIIWG